MPNELTLVTGAAGFMGRRLCQWLADQGRSVLAQVLPGEQPPACLRHVVADLRQEADVRRLADGQVRTVIHLAGLSSVPKSTQDPRADLEVNLLGTFNLLEAARRMELRSFVFASTVSVLDVTNPLPLAETAVCGPSAPYGAAKLAGEGYCKAYWRTYGLPARVVRFFNVYGPGLRRQVVYEIIHKALANPRRIEMIGDGQQIRDFLYVDDAVAGMGLVADRGVNGEIYHLGSGQPVTIRELIDVIIRQMRLTDTEIVSAVHAWKGDIPRWYADITKVAALGFAPGVDLATGVTRTLEWVRAQKD